MVELEALKAKQSKNLTKDTGVLTDAKCGGVQEVDVPAKALAVLEIQSSQPQPQPKQSCLVCYNDRHIVETEMISCSRPDPTTAHWLCAPCFNDLTRSQCSHLGDFTKHGKKIVCPTCIAEKPEEVYSPFMHSAVCSKCNNDVVELYIEAQRNAVRKIEQ